MGGNGEGAREGTRGGTEDLSPTAEYGGGEWKSFGRGGNGGPENP
jgi:hypothetical protein